MGFVDRIQQNAARSAAARRGGASTGQGGKARAPKRPPAPPLNQLECRIGYGIALAAAVAFVAIWVPHLGDVVPKVVVHAGKAAPKKPASPAAELAFGLVLAAILGWSTVIKRRWLLALVSFYVGLAPPWGSYRVFGYALMAVGAWLLFRNAKLQADAQAAAKAAAAKASRSPGRSQSPARSQAPSRSSARTRSAYATSPSGGSPRSTRGPSGKRQAPARARAAKAAKGSKAESAERAVPAPSKRYTPAQAGDRKERRERRESVRSGAANRSSSPKV